MQKNLDKVIIITGAAGFIGSNVVRHLNQQGYQNLILVDDLKTGDKWKNLVGKTFTDILSKDYLFEWLNDHGQTVDSIIHLGACSSTVETDADYLLNNNYRFSQALAEFAIDHDVRFIYASSAATYGDGAQGFVDDDSLLSTLRPLNMYGYSKHLFDLWLQKQKVLDRVVGLKYFNVFGPNEAHKGRMASVINHFVPLIKKEGRIKLFKSSEPSLYADGEQVRDFIYVEDAAKITTAFLDNSNCGIYNVGTGQPTSWKTVTESIFEAMDLPPQIEYIAMPDDLIGKYQNYTCADTKKTKSALGTQAITMPIPTAVKKYVKEFVIPGRLW